ncbi:hypothetical protein [Tardiphaga sp. 367_B4_N1_1]|uniref:hypothetical protein n=1 Tax=Tardiphaga sp. 367_B4_N1_1 TaxID=3240777 RepID=UPI003F22BC9F
MTLSTIDIVEAIKAGSKLHRQMERVELRHPDGSVGPVPHDLFDALMSQGQIEPTAGGFYRLKG